ncbi:hypothetical protein F5051DRAFT_447537 [Lentinula edodes]|nr:hypothetical protein F5051DRAFT_447537 [Lentinula edodes]
MRIHNVRYRTTTTTVSATAGPSWSRPVPPPPPPPSDSATQEEDDLEDEDEDDIIRKAQARVERVRARKAAEAARRKAEEEAARAAAEKKRKAQERAKRARQQEEEVVERRRLLAAAATARSQWGTSPSEVSASPRRPVVEIRRTKSKGKGKARAEPVGGDPDDGDEGDDKEPCERCRVKKISCQMQAGKRSSVICKPCHDVKVRCSYSGRPSTVKREGSSNPTGERLAVLESQVAQLLADNRQLRDGQVKANTYHQHMNRKLDWLVTDAARRRRTPPEMPQVGIAEEAEKGNGQQRRRGSREREGWRGRGGGTGAG